MKNRTALRLLGLLTIASLGLNTQARASTVGLTPDTSNSYGVWDTFPSVNFTGRAPDAGTAASAQALSLTSNGFLLGNGDRIYLNGAPSSWTTTGTPGYAIKSFTLQLKNYQFTSQSLATYFTASLTTGGNTFAPDSAVTTTLPEGTGTTVDEILTWTWSGSLASNTGSSFSVNFANANGANISIDGFDLSANPTAAGVPEPSTIAVVVSGLAALCVVRRIRLRMPA